MVSSEDAPVFIVQISETDLIAEEIACIIFVACKFRMGVRERLYGYTKS